MWFSERERIFTTAAMAGAAAFGAMIGEQAAVSLIGQARLAKQLAKQDCIQI